MYKEYLVARVDLNLRHLAKKMAETQGITVSEYIRQLVIADLDRRSVFTTKLKQDLDWSEINSQGVKEV